MEIVRTHVRDAVVDDLNNLVERGLSRFWIVSLSSFFSSNVSCASASSVRHCIPLAAFLLFEPLFWGVAQLTRTALASRTMDFDALLTFLPLPWPLPSTFPLSSMCRWSPECQQAVLRGAGWCVVLPPHRPPRHCSGEACTRAGALSASR